MRMGAYTWMAGDSVLPPPWGVGGMESEVFHFGL